MNAILLAKKFGEQGHDARAWFLMRSGYLETENVETKLMLEREPRSVSDWSRLLKSLNNSLAETKPDVIIGFQPLANILAGLSSFTYPHKCIATQRNPARSQTRILQIIEGIVGSTNLYASNIAVSNAVVDSFVAYPRSYKRKFAVVHNGLPPLPYSPLSKSECRSALGLPEGGFFVGTIGRLHYQKFPDFLLEVAQHLPEMNLALAGEGPEDENLRLMKKRLGIDSRVWMLGNLTGVDVTRFYKAMDIFLLPSRFEGFGRTLVESFSVGTPAIVSDLPVLREVGGDAAMYLALEVETWVRELRRLSNARDDLEKISRKGLLRARHFSLDSMVTGYIEQAEKSLKN